MADDLLNTDDLLNHNGGDHTETPTHEGETTLAAAIEETRSAADLAIAIEETQNATPSIATQWRALDDVLEAGGAGDAAPVAEAHDPFASGAMNAQGLPIALYGDGEVESAPSVAAPSTVTLSAQETPLSAAQQDVIEAVFGGPAPAALLSYDIASSDTLGGSHGRAAITS
ncbi:MAG: hypothetical protein AAGM38_01840, partial [Pseudomonadota bacterium]